VEDFDSKFVELIPKLTIYARSLTKEIASAEDLVNTTYIKARKNIDSFKGENLTPWLKTILKNTFLDNLRKKRESQLGDDTQELMSEGEQEASLLKRDIDMCLERLTESAREIVALKGRGYSYSDISAFTEKTEENVRVVLHRARKDLHDCLEGN